MNGHPFSTLTLFIFLSALILGCSDSVPTGRILVRNDSRDSEYNVIRVSGGGAVFSLSPGESRLLPSRTGSFTVSRQYKDYVRRYSVSCPRSLEAGIVVKLIDIHLNRISGGCTTTSASKG
jgi:hypothetical protein